MGLRPSAWASTDGLIWPERTMVARAENSAGVRLLPTSMVRSRRLNLRTAARSRGPETDSGSIGGGCTDTSAPEAEDG